MSMFYKEYTSVSSGEVAGILLVLILAKLKHIRGSSMRYFKGLLIFCEGGRGALRWLSDPAEHGAPP